MVSEAWGGESASERVVSCEYTDVSEGQRLRLQGLFYRIRIVYYLNIEYLAEYFNTMYLFYVRNNICFKKYSISFTQAI